MAKCPSKKIDSNATGLRVAEEDCIGILPAAPVWSLLQPNDYGSFGAEYDMVSRTPINPSRQQKKGTQTNVTATSVFTQDLTMDNMTNLMQGFMFANAHVRQNINYFGGDSIEVTANNEYVNATASPFQEGTIVYAKGFANPANNGMKVVGPNVAEGTLVPITTPLIAEPANPNASVITVGEPVTKSSITRLANGQLQVVFSFDAMYLEVGEWIYVENSTMTGGFMRVASVSEDESSGEMTYIMDKSSALMPIGDDLSLTVYVGVFIHNEENPANIVRRSYQFERTLGSDDTGVQAQYVVGAVPNQLTINLPSADKSTVELDFVATSVDTTTGTQGLKAGTRVNPQYDENAINTSQDVARLNMSIMKNGVVDTTLFSYATDFSIVVNNNVTPNNAIGILGAVDVTAGIFEVSCSVTAYFTSVASLDAIKNNADVAIDAIIYRDNKGIIFDIPLVTLGGGQVAVALNEPVTVPLENTAAQSSFGYTMSYTQFDYLP